MFEVLLVAVVGLNVWADFIDRRAAVRSDPAALSLWTTITQFLLVVPLVGLTGKLTAGQLFVCAVVGTFTALARIPWYKALSSPGQKLSRLAPFTRLSSVMVIVLAFTVLGESFSTGKMSGAFLMVAGALMISLERSFTSLRDYLADNRAVLLVLVFAASLALISLFYKYMLNAGVPIITTYFFLKTFQCAAAVAYSMHRRDLKQSFGAILDLQLFVQGRALQTLAAFLYLLVLRNVDLSTVEPIAAAIGPVLYLAIDKVSEWRAKASGRPDEGAISRPPARRGQYAAYAGSAATACGLYLVVRG